MKATLIFLVTMALSNTVWAGGQCSVYFKFSPLSKYGRQIKSVLERKGYPLVQDASSALAIVQGFGIECNHGSNETCESATAYIQLVDRYTGQIFYYQGTHESTMFGANYQKALARALSEIPSCQK